MVMAVRKRVPEEESLEREAPVEGYNLIQKVTVRYQLDAIQEFGRRVKPSGRALEVGPGPGYVGIELAKFRPDLEVVGLEISAECIRIAERNVKRENLGDRIQYVQGSVAAIGFPNHFFDGVISTGSLHHWSDPVVGFGEINRVLKPEGALLITDPLRSAPDSLLDQYIEAFLEEVELFITDPEKKGALSPEERAFIDGSLIKQWSIAKQYIADGWHRTWQAGYIKEEVEAMLAQIGIANWNVSESGIRLTLSK